MRGGGALLTKAAITAVSFAGGLFLVADLAQVAR